MDNKTIFNLIETNHNHTVELMTSMKTAINAETKASADMLNLKIDGVIARQDISNNRVSKLEKQTGFVRWVYSNPKLAIPLFLILFVGVVFLIEKFGIEFLLKL